MQRSGDIDVKIEEGKFIAQRIKGAKFVEFEGDDHLFWAGNISEIIDEMKAFINELKPLKPERKGLITVLFGKLSDTQLDKVLPILKEYFCDQGAGVMLHVDHQYFMVGFEGPRKAIQSGMALSNKLRGTEQSSSIGLYVKQGSLDGRYHQDEEDLYMIDKMLSSTSSNSIMVTQAVRHLLLGSSISFSEETSILKYDSGNLCKLYQVSTPSQNDDESILNYSKYDSFLDDLIKIIHEHLDNTSFSLETMTKSVGMSERQLQRRVKEATGKSPGQLITSIRLSKAKQILMQHKHTVSEIAFLCGFSSPSYFTKCFNKEFGYTPKDIVI